MISELKKQLLEDPENICTLLEEFEFEHITIKRNEIRFARNSEGGQNIRIKLENNDYLNVTDYARSEHCDIVSYIIKEKHTDFRTILTAIKRILHLSDDWRPQSRRLIFGGVYENIMHKVDAPPKVYDESTLDEYLKIPNVRFQRDHISLETQMEFGIGYDVETDRITIPIRDQHGSLMGIKGRANFEVNEETPKYLYLVPCQMSKTLFGYSTNYSSMYGGTIMVFESEKSVLQCASYGYHNAVALGSNSLSEYQAKMILSLNPQKVIFMLDNDLPLENTKRNIDMLRSIVTMRDLQISYFDWTECLDLPAKASASDEGKEVLEDILAENIKDETELEEKLCHFLFFC